MIKSLVKNYLKCCLFSLILGSFYASPAAADVCFLPSGGCQSQMVRTSPDPTPEDCSRWTRQGYTAFSAVQSGVDCQLCNGTYYCKCDGNYKKADGRCVERCPASEYPLTTKKATPWQCEACSDALSNNYNKRYKNCTCPSPYTQIGSNKCVDCQSYDVSASDAATKKTNGYSCLACDNDAASGKYKCSCSGTEKTVNGVKKCFPNCTDDKKELNNDGVCVCKSNYPNEYNNACYPVCSAPKGRFEKGECLCSEEYNHTKADNETCTGGCTDKNGTKYKTGECQTSCIKTASHKYKVSEYNLSKINMTCSECDGYYKCVCDKEGDIINEFVVSGTGKGLVCHPEGSGGSDDGGSDSGCSANSYTASVWCVYKGIEEYHSDCPGQQGVGLYECTFNVPSCAFSKLSVYDKSGKKVLYEYGAGTNTRTVGSCKLSGSGGAWETYCQFYQSIGMLAEVRQTFVNGKGWGCEYTRSIR